MLVLGIESTCDETAVSVVRSGRHILSNAILSQTDLHSKYGGVFPELASRRHVEGIAPLIEEALATAGVNLQQIELIAVAKGPGLIGSLLVGLHVAKALSLALGIPFVGVNHVEAHLYAAMMATGATIHLPAIGVVISGGHTLLTRILGVGHYESIGSTLDDAVGEAFDKVATLLDLPYPGGPEIEALAKHGDPTLYAFKPGKIRGNPWAFSFSGLKTQVLYAVRKEPQPMSSATKAHIAAAFQEVALGDIVHKSLLAKEAFGAHAILLGGGVSSNLRLQEMFEERHAGRFLHLPPTLLRLDNAAMIAGLGYHLLQAKPGGDALDLVPMTRMPLCSWAPSPVTERSSV